MEEESEIATISNKYKNTLNEFIDSSDTKSPYQPESLDWPRLIDKGIRNAPRFKGTSPNLLEEDCLNKNILVTILERALKTQDF